MGPPIGRLDALMLSPSSWVRLYRGDQFGYQANCGRHFPALFGVETANLRGPRSAGMSAPGTTRKRIHMKIRIVSAPARPVRRSLFTTVAALTIFAVSAANAQAPAPAPA